jgi:predicted secreted hydrolase
MNADCACRRRPPARATRALCRLGLALFLVFAAGDWTRSSDPDAWRHAAPGYRFSFPRDHASHPDYKLEWWYYTGNLHTKEGRRFGYQATFFRVGVDYRPVNPSRWAVRDLFLTHLAVSDIGDRGFRCAEILNRAGPGWAGAESSSYRVWNGNSQVSLDADGPHVVRANGGGIGVDLKLLPEKAPVLNGEHGYSRKGSQAGNASYYYSITRMRTSGTLVVDGERFDVEGLSWMDHEFGTSFLDAEQTGWDWFSIQLEDGAELMLFQLRRRDGAPDIHSSGTFVDQQGRTSVFEGADFQMESGKTWRSLASGAVYPVEWRLRVPSLQLDVNARAALADQELRFENSSGVTYWEGVIDVSGQRAGRAVGGRGYLEMTGYTGRAMSSVLR